MKKLSRLIYPLLLVMSMYAIFYFYGFEKALIYGVGIIFTELIIIGGSIEKKKL